MPEYYIDESGFIIGPARSRPNRIKTNYVSNKPYSKCPVCSVQVQVRHLAKHIRKMHPDYSADNSHASKEPSLPVQTVESTTANSAPLVSISAQGRKRVMTQCPYCSSPVRADRLKRHIQTKCPARKNALPQADKHISSNAKPGKQQESVSSMDTVTWEPNIKEEALRQSFDEPIYGGKYLGHMRREFDGKFGSLPLYDDYDDEADAD